jgi:hypothetical protein
VTLARTLFVAAAVLLVAGLALRLAPTPVPRLQAEALSVPPEVGRDSGRTGRRGPTVYDDIIPANIFSQDRTAPAVRFSLPGRAVAPTKPRGPTLRLYGITVGGQGPVALIDADPNIPGAEIYRLGDLVAGARVVAITDSTVTLARPSGQLVLRLPPAKRRSGS